MTLVALPSPEFYFKLISWSGVKKGLYILGRGGVGWGVGWCVGWGGVGRASKTLNHYK